MSVIIGLFAAYFFVFAFLIARAPIIDINGNLERRAL